MQCNTDLAFLLLKANGKHDHLQRVFLPAGMPFAVQQCHESCLVVGTLNTMTHSIITNLLAWHYSHFIRKEIGTPSYGFNPKLLSHRGTYDRKPTLSDPLHRVPDKVEGKPNPGKLYNGKTLGHVWCHQLPRTHSLIKKSS